MRFKQHILICVVFVELDLPRLSQSNFNQRRSKFGTKEKDPCMKISGEGYLLKDSFVVDLLPSDLHQIRSSVPAKCISAKSASVVDPYGSEKTLRLTIGWP